MKYSGDEVGSTECYFVALLLGMCTLPFRLTLQQFFFGHAEDLAHGVVELLGFCVAGYVWGGQRLHRTIVNRMVG